MCGIAGILLLGKEQNNSIDYFNSIEFVKNMLSAIHYRGPDNSTVISTGNAVIGANLLAILDKTNGSQPKKSLSGELVLALNGEIYNFCELLAKLKEYRPLNSRTDTEVLLYLFEDYGIDCLHYLNGMFAFVVTNGKQAYLVRDRFGVKPLYYSFRENYIYFSSEAKTLIQERPVLNLETTYSNFETSLGNETLFSGIFEIPAGSYLEIDLISGIYKVIRYYSLPLFSNSNELSEKQAIDYVRYLVEDAIKLRTQNISSYGCFVSGGIDSSIIASQSSPDYLFSAIVQERDYLDEEKYVLTLEKFINHKIVRIKPKIFDVIKYLVEIVYVLDFPVTSFAALSQYLLSMEARKKDLRVTLTGLGADEYMGGYMRHLAIFFPAKDIFSQKAYKNYTPLLKKIENLSADSFVDKYFTLINRSTLSKNELAKQYIHNIYNPNDSLLNNIAKVDFAISFPPLLRMDDRINMLFNIESRSPFLDYRLIEFFFSIGDNLKIKKSEKSGYTSKYILRQAFADSIPKEILDRKDKVGFPSAIGIWMSNPAFDYGLKKAYAIISEIETIKSLFPRAAIKSLNEFSRCRWIMLQFAIWHLLFFEKLSVDEVTKIIFDKFLYFEHI